MRVPPNTRLDLTNPDAAQSIAGAPLCLLSGLAAHAHVGRHHSTSYYNNPSNRESKRPKPVYIPKHFEENRPEELHRVIRDYPLGVLVLRGAQGLDANHIPFELDQEDEKTSLFAHVARANPLWQAATDGDDALVIFRAANAYISPNWYPSKHEFHKQVPTWNYQAVHAHGRIYVRDDERFVRAIVARLTRTNETRSGQERPWKMTDSSKDYIDQMISAVVGIEIVVDDLVGKWKLSQNKEERDRSTAASELQKRGEQITSAAMLETLGPGA